MISFRTMTLLVMAAAVGACGGKSGGGGGGGLDEAALKGSWEGDFGSITFGEDGKAKLVVKNCGWSVLGPGQVEKPKNVDGCDDHTFEGDYEVDGYKVSVGESGGMKNNFQAYIDETGGLHLATTMGYVSRLPGKTGDAKVSMFDTLAIAESGCKLSSKMKDGDPKDVKCRWETKDGATIFVYEAESRFKKGEMEERGLVYLDKLGLLVPAGLAATVYKKKP